MTLEIFHVDAFTDRPFAGNPAAVCLLERPADREWMQAVAMEMNLSETAYVAPISDGLSLRWFTPESEVDLCGHATLASAHVLWETGRLSESSPARFHTRSGVLTCSLEQNSGAWISMDFPANSAVECPPPAGLLEALVCHARFVGSNRMDFLVELDSEEALQGLAPDFRALRGVEARGVIVTARAPKSLVAVDFISRFFAPAVGIDEDPVTGSAHCCLAPYWATKLGTNDLVGYQASRRGGTVRMRVNGERVALIGQAVTVMRGRLNAGSQVTATVAAS